MEEATHLPWTSSSILKYALYILQPYKQTHYWCLKSVWLKPAAWNPSAPSFILSPESYSQTSKLKKRNMNPLRQSEQHKWLRSTRMFLFCPSLDSIVPSPSPSCCQVGQKWSINSPSLHSSSLLLNCETERESCARVEWVTWAPCTLHILCLATDTHTHTFWTHTHTCLYNGQRRSSSNESSSCGWWIRAEQEFPVRFSGECRTDLHPASAWSQTKSNSYQLAHCIEKALCQKSIQQVSGTALSEKSWACVTKTGAFLWPCVNCLIDVQHILTDVYGQITMSGCKCGTTS